MLEEFNRYISENDLFKAEDKLLLAVSGGIDSMVMTDLFIKTGSDIGIAHCNFNLRGAESDRDEAFVKRVAGKDRIPFHSVSFDTTGYAAEKGISIQMAARELRYRWFEEVRSQNGYDYIVLAHNLNDNVETFLINLIRGTGIAGLSGIKPKYRKLARPMLFASRNAIIQYSKMNKLKFREDRSNSDIKYTRNRIRHTILPLFREINPSFDSTITETAVRLGEINEIVTAYIAGIRQKSTLIKGDKAIIRLRELKDLTPKSTILYELFRPFGVIPGQTDDLVRLTEGKTGSQLFTRTSRLLKNRNEILIMPFEPDPEKHFEIKSPDDFRKFQEFSSAEIKQKRRNFRIPETDKIACLDADKITFPMVVRNWVQGDFFYPLGMKSKKKLSDYFIDKKYSLPQKEQQLILESDGKIAWIIGERIDNRFRVTPSTRKVIIIKSTGK